MVENLTKNKSGEIAAAMEASDNQNKELVKMLDKMNDQLEEEHSIQALSHKPKVSVHL